MVHLLGGFTIGVNGEFSIATVSLLRLRCAKSSVIMGHVSGGVGFDARMRRDFKKDTGKRGQSCCSRTPKQLQLFA